MTPKCLHSAHAQAHPRRQCRKGYGRTRLTTAANSFGQVTVIVLPTGRLFGRLSQKGPNKRGAAGHFCGRILADFERSAEKGPNFEKIVSLLLSSLVLGKRPRNIVILPLTQT